MTSPAPGAARSPGATYQDLLDPTAGRRTCRSCCGGSSNEYLGAADIPRARYVSREFHELEKEKLWKKVWQMACREEDIPDVGDTLVYDICDLSILVVRIGAGHHPGVLQRLPAPRPPAEGGRRQQHRAALRRSTASAGTSTAR